MAAALAFCAAMSASRLGAQTRFWSAAESIPVDASWQEQSGWLVFDPKRWEQFEKEHGAAPWGGGLEKWARLRQTTLCGLGMECVLDPAMARWPALHVYGPVGAGRHETAGTPDIGTSPPLKNFSPEWLGWMLGEVAPPGVARPDDLEQNADWCHNELVFGYEPPAGAFRFDPEGRLRLVVSRLSPAIFFENNDPAINFFRNARMPSCFAFEQDGEISVVNLKAAPRDIEGLNTRWLMAWFADDSKAWWPTHPLYSIGRNNAYFSIIKGSYKYGPPRDCPLLFVFRGTLGSVTISAEGGLGLESNGDEIAGVVCPLFGKNFPLRDETIEWAKAAAPAALGGVFTDSGSGSPAGKGLPGPIAEQVMRLVDCLALFPITCSEEYAWDRENDTVTVKNRFAFEPVLEHAPGSGAPAPPMLALAHEQGLPMSFSSNLVDTGVSTPYGPWKLAPRETELSWSMPGLGALVAPRMARHDLDKAPERLRMELEAEVEKILDAGHMAPFVYHAGIWSIPTSSSLHWSQPGDTLYYLAEIHDLLPESAQKRLREYMARERRDYPPEDIVTMDFREGARREWWNFDADTMSRYEFVAWDRIPVRSLYGLAAYHTVMANEVLEPDVWTKCKDILMATASAHDWASLGWFRFGAEPAEIRGDKGSAFHTFRDAAGRFRGGVMAANSYFAGLLGFIRLADRRGDSASAEYAAGLLARAAAMRFGMGKLPAYLYSRGLCELPPDSKWMTELVWDDDGFLHTFDYATPDDDIRQVVAMDEFGVFLLEQTEHHNQPYMVPFLEMTPELGRFLRQHLRPECERYFARAKLNLPDWWVSFGEAILGGDKNNHRYPAEPHQLFIEQAWVEAKSGPVLESHIDSPHARLGDFFHLQKLAETIRAYAGAGDGSVEGVEEEDEKTRR